MAQIDKIQRKEFEAQIVKELLGAPYLYKGRDAKGTDCWGLLLIVYKMAGVGLFDIPSIEYNDKDWSKKGGNFLAENLWRDWQKVEHPEFLDAILFNTEGGAPNHCGVMLRDGKFIHCGNHGVQVARLSETKKTRTVAGYYRLKPLYDDF